MSDIELKKCPFCGGEAEIIDDAMGTISRCQWCGAENGNGVYGADGHKLAVKDWNNRPIEDALKAENERLKKELDDLKKEDLLRADTKKVIDYALKEGIIEFPSLKSNAQRFREALETICAIYEINGAEWRFDKRLYEVAKEALEGKDD